MQRKDIKAGDELYYCVGDPYGYREGYKVTVVDADLWVRESEYARRHNPELLEFHKAADKPYDRKRAGVLVDVDYADRVRRDTISPRYLHGPFAETAAAVKAARDLKVAAASKEATERNVRQRLAYVAGRQAETLGVGGFSDWDYRHVTVPVERFAAMVAALTEAGWKYEPTTEATEG